MVIVFDYAQGWSSVNPACFPHVEGIMTLAEPIGVKYSRINSVMNQKKNEGGEKDSA